MKGSKLILSLLLCCFLNSLLDAQVYLQIERKNTLKKIKLFEGEEIKFKTKEFKDTWRTETIENIIPESNTLVMGGDLFQLEEIHAISLLRKPFLFNLGTQLQRLGLTLAVYGTIVDLANWEEFGLEGYIVSAGISTLGTILKMIFKKKVFNMSKKHRLRIIDTRFFIPDAP